MSLLKSASIARFAIGVGLVLLIGPIARGEDPFDVEIRAIVDDIVPQIKDYIDKNRKEATVTVGTFESLSDKLPGPGSSITLALRERLKEGLTRLGVPIARASGIIRINGTFKVGSDPVSGKPATLITCTVVDNSGPGEPKVLVNKKRTVVDTMTAIKLSGTSVNNTSQPSKEKLDTAVNAAIDNPPVVTVENKLRVRTSNESPYAIEIRVNGRPREIEMKDGLAYVSIKTGDTFAVLLVNGSKRDAGVSLSIDGINSFTFQEKNPDAKVAPMSDWIVPTTGGYIEGWFINPNRMDKFQLTDDPKDIAALTINADASDVGTITAVFKAAWFEGQLPPDDEPKVSGGKSVEFGVKRGAEIAIDAPPRPTYFGVIRDSITIRYSKSSDPAPARPQPQPQARAGEASANRP